MKIKKGKKSGLVVTLGRDDVTGTVEIYAARSDGGWTVDVLNIEGGQLLH